MPPLPRFHVLARVNNPQGMHTGPWMEFVERACKYEEAVWVGIDRTMIPATPQNIMALFTLEACFESVLVIEVVGTKAEEVCHVLKEFVETFRIELF